MLKLSIVNVSNKILRTYTPFDIICDMFVTKWKTVWLTGMLHDLVGFVFDVATCNWKKKTNSKVSNKSILLSENNTIKQGLFLIG